MLTPSVFQQTTRFFSDLLESTMSEDWVEKNFGFAMSDYAMFPQNHDDDHNNNNKQLLDASTDPQLPSFHASFTMDDLCVKMGDEEEDEEEEEEDGYMEEMDRDEDLEEIAEAAMLEWNKQQNFAVDLPTSAGLVEVNRNPIIAKNPWSWTIDDAKSWCDWALARFRVSDAQRNHLLKSLQLSGNDLCQLSVADFQEHFEASGKYLYAELELWKNIYIISSSESEQKLYDTKVDRDVSDITSKATAVSGCIPLGLNKLTEEIASSTVTTNCLPRVSTVCPPIITSTPLLSALTSDLSTNNLRSTTTTTTITTTIGQQSSTIQRRFPTPLEQRIPTFVVDSTPDTPSCENESSAGGPLLSEYAPSGGCVGAKEAEGLWGCFDGTRFLSDADSGISLDSDCTSSYEASQKNSSGGDDSPEIWQSHAKQGNHLWQFLHELLRQPSLYVDCIRWMDRKQGIFKIEDSVHVAKLWGERKNRPAMNYDKLSRSIRQYYKKGIIRKTNQSKRLVYQFCPRYA